MQFNKSSFWNLLSKSEIKNITIPIIQRAYTQGGRSGDAKIETKGQKFLDRLVLALTDTSKPILLDFIYGSESKNKVFPLDGQQRLTTLFLLHWYIAQKEGKLKDDIKNVLKKFTYETRQSSRYFCEHLYDYTIPTTRTEKISDTIKNEKWFMLSWENDPSIRSMFGMLDKIDIALKDKTNSYWNILTTDIENCPITFFYTSLQNLNLTDDLYIKMNARGLELTDFEKLKAAFNQKIDNEKWDESKAITDKFGHRIDTIWTDLFWNYKGTDDLIDNELVNFIASIAINYYAINYTQNDKDKIETRITTLSNNSNEVCPDDFSTFDAYNYLVNCLDIYAENLNDKIKIDTNLWSYCDKTLFEDLLLGENITQQRRVLFFAQTEYLLNNVTFVQSSFNDWMRVCRNLVENAISGNWNVTLMGNLIKIIRNWASQSNDIYKHLSTQSLRTSGTAKDQINQEIEKAKIIVANPTANKQVIFDTEDTSFCKGDIDFALDCIDYLTTPFSPTALQTLQKIIQSELDKPITDDFIRAFLTIKGNDYYQHWYSSSWISGIEEPKRSLRTNPKTKQDIRINFAKSNDWRRDYLKNLIIQRMSKSFADIANDYTIPAEMPKWKEKLITEREKLQGATFIIIANNDSYCYLAWQQKPSREDHVTKITNT